MKMTYDPEADVLHLQLRGGAVEASEDAAPGITFDFDADGRVVGIEFVGASKQVEGNPLALSLELLRAAKDRSEAA